MRTACSRDPAGGGGRRVIPREHRPPGGSGARDPLSAEYAADFATQSMNHALLAALRAVERQLAYEEEKKGETGNE